MKWKDILKNVITQGRVKEIEDIDIDIEDDDCKRELQRLANKLKNYKPVVEKTWKEGWHENYSKYGELIIEVEPIADGDGKSFVIRNNRDYSFPIVEFLIYHFYEPDNIPESVACKALEMLKEEKSDNENIEINGTYYRIERTFNKTKDTNEIFSINGLQVYKNGKTVLILETISEIALKYPSYYSIEALFVREQNILFKEIAKKSGINADTEFSLRWHK
tara:strand:- start:2467 stop:3126 length:660 start_codon:yes stop_codon:yes gene_type:complete